MEAAGLLPSPFPTFQSPILPSPASFFAGNLQTPPLPTNSFWQNYALGNGDQPEYIHPYLVKSSNGSLSISYPSMLVTMALISQLFLPDISILSNTLRSGINASRHTISHFDDLSVKLDLPGGLSFPLVRGSPYITCLVSGNNGGGGGGISITSNHSITSIRSSNSSTVHTIKLDNRQTWKLYSSSPIYLTTAGAIITNIGQFSGVIRIAVVPNSATEAVLDQYSGVYPVSGTATITKPFCMDYQWKKQGGSGDLLLLTHPLHRRLLKSGTMVPEIQYESIDGNLIGVAGDTWTLCTSSIPITWHSISGISNDSSPEIITAVKQDINGLNNISTSSSYFYGKAIARAARLAMIANELQYNDVIPNVRQFLRDSITPWLEGSFKGNGFLYEPKWGGLTTRSGSTDQSADFGFGIYNDHHYHLGYFSYASAVLAKLDQDWGGNYKKQIYALVADFLSPNSSAAYPKLRNYDMWKMHSWAGGLTEFGDGRNQESSSEAVAAYYAAALVGKAFGDEQLVMIGSTVAAMEMEAAQTWWHVGDAGHVYDSQFSNGNRVTGVLWSNKRDTGLWFASADRRECRLGIQVLPILPITEILFRDSAYVNSLVNWTLPALQKQGVDQDGWKGFVYAMQGVYDRGSALQEVRNLQKFDDGNSLSNLLWWLHSRKSS